MPKGRYAIMRRYMPLVGSMGLDMMTRTCTVQVNLDYASEADMRRKLRVSLLLQPLATALFANSPFTEGRPNGFLSYRAQVWTDTDNQRVRHPRGDVRGRVRLRALCRLAGRARADVFRLSRRRLHRRRGRDRFADFMAGRVPELAGETATLGDFADHVTTAFTDVRLKRILEMRGADAGRADMMLAQSALWVGLLYDDAALAAAESLLRGAGWEDAVTARAAVPRQGLAAPWRGGTLRDIVPDVVAIAKDGLRARSRHDAAGNDEQVLLAPLQAIAEGAPTQAEHWLAQYHGPWRGDASRVLAEAAI
jgi:glutamate--cysteine ligase